VYRTRDTERWSARVGQKSRNKSPKTVLPRSKFHIEEEHAEKKNNRHQPILPQKGELGPLPGFAIRRCAKKSAGGKKTGSRFLPSKRERGSRPLAEKIGQRLEEGWGVFIDRQGEEALATIAEREREKKQDPISSTGQARRGQTRLN